MLNFQMMDAPPPKPVPPVKPRLSLRHLPSRTERGGREEMIAEESRKTGASIDAILKRTAPPWTGKKVQPPPSPETHPHVLFRKPPRTTPDGLLGAEEEPPEVGEIPPIAPPVVPTEAQDLADWEADLSTRDQLLRRARTMLDEKERALKEQEMLLAARERYLRESERLFQERRQHAENHTEVPVTASMKESYEKLKAELDQRESTLRESESMLQEREQFVQESENVLFEKAQQLQEWETRLEALHDELEGRRGRLDAEAGVEHPQPPKEVL